MKREPVLLSGLIQSLGTPWGLLRHYWVLVKLLLTTFATIVLLEKVPLIDSTARRAAEAKLSDAGLRAAGMPLAIHAAGGLLVLFVITTLSVYKLWGLTLYGRRRQEKRCQPLRTATVKAMSDPDNEIIGVGLSSRLKILLVGGVGVFLVAVHISMHHIGHTLHHGH
ncbi:MAG TPA: hypothetical protein VH350_01705 [Candidatus Sulfotelmatobacter sp.]|nr:hypothetical protein [Candidatus Sulfotelmatobacter sp.]